MRSTTLALAICAALLSACAEKKSMLKTAESPSSSASSESSDAPLASNPLLQPSKLFQGAPRFDLIKDEHYGPALDEALRQAKSEIDEIANATAAPSFANTIDALERSGALLSALAPIFANNSEANSSEILLKTASEFAAKSSAFQDSITLDPKLFARVQTLFQQRETLGLNAEQLRVLERYHRNFVRNGAQLDASQKLQLTEWNAELSKLTDEFGQRVLKETQDFKLVIENPADLAGLPDSVINTAAALATEQNMPGKWVFTIQAPSLWPFMQYSANRMLREKMFTAYTLRANRANANNTNELAVKIANLRAKRAQLLGFETHAHYILSENVAGNPQTVYKMLNELMPKALTNAKLERADMQKLIDAEKGGFKLAPWDWFYYAEKVRIAQYDLDEAEVRPYLELENVKAGLFDTMGKLFGLKFIKRAELPGYAEGVTAYEIQNTDGSYVGLAYFDYYARPNKRGGAWMNSWRDQQKLTGDVKAITVNVCNFAKPTPGQPTLLSFDETQTLFHEFGHALHGLMSDVTYPSLSGTNVPRDYVEFPSQVLESWVLQPQVLKRFAKHYQTGAAIPDALIQKIANASKFNQGFASTEYLAASLLDMDWHSIRADQPVTDAQAFEKASLKRMGLIDEINPRYRTSYFNHVFQGGYSAGYYGYIWAEVMDADAFAAFKENGDIFDPTLSAALRREIFASGNSRDPLESFKAFRGRAPKIDALLERRGLR